MSTFTDRMEAGRVNAATARARGLPTGKSAKGWNVKRPDPANGTWDYKFASVKADWTWTRGGIFEDYLATVYPERYEAIEF